MSWGRAALLLLLVALAGAGWWLFGRHGERPAELTVRWGGKSAGTMTLPATLSWCPVTRIGVLEAMSGDSGVTLVLYERDSLSPGAHAIVFPDFAPSSPKPAATFVMRWLRFSPDTALVGYRSESGTARLQLTGGKASGDVNARVRAVAQPDTLVVQAVFSGVPVVATAKGCT